MSEDVAIEVSEVLSFWFEQPHERWFEKQDAFDDEIRRRFLSLHEKACRGELDFWRSDGTARAFASDEQARLHARAILDNGWNEAMSPDERTFAYLPFEHSEAIRDQELSIRLFEGDPNFDWAVKHWEVIRRFGRFPHRNAALGRECTLEELEFLKDPSSGF